MFERPVVLLLARIEAAPGVVHAPLSIGHVVLLGERKSLLVARKRLLVLAAVAVDIPHTQQKTAQAAAIFTISGDRFGPPIVEERLIQPLVSLANLFIGARLV